ncbi:hypothetical protein D088_870012 [Salmonella enterica subsp. houtenae serovar 16:z4,z32:-- str. RKS3027]|nr:hypothetical protein D088_870012 [Salmonella enterica subsp. houtenae serovar 16:z4,z32:-- str. RKS3027]
MPSSAQREKFTRTVHEHKSASTRRLQASHGKKSHVTEK